MDQSIITIEPLVKEDHTAQKLDKLWQIDGGLYCESEND